MELCYQNRLPSANNHNIVLTLYQKKTNPPFMVISRKVGDNFLSKLTTVQRA